MYNRSMSPRRSLAALLPVALATVLLASCDSRDVEKVLKVTDVHTGWYDAGIVDGENKIVPSVSFHLQNVTSDSIDRVQVNAVFRQVGEDLAWGDRLIRGVGSDGLAGGATGGMLVVRGPRGFTSPLPRAQMFTHKLFVDVKVDLFAGHGSRTWVKLGEFPIERKLLTE
jgi:hypothetical protein